MTKSFLFFPEKPTIRYIWIGSPRTNCIDEAQIDTLGPLQLAHSFTQAHLDQAIEFYCLDEYVNHFKQMFIQCPNLAVKSIDLLFDSFITVESQNFLKDAKRIFDKDKLGEIRQRVDAKNLASLMILYLLGGYYLDTTVFPNAEKLNFPAYPCFMVPLLSEDRSNKLIYYSTKEGEQYLFPFFKENDGSSESQFVRLLGTCQRTKKISAHHMIDVFAMYSPKNGDGVARAIQFYVKFFPVLKETRKIGIEDEIADTADSLIDAAVNRGYFGSNPSCKWLTPYTLDEKGQAKRILTNIGCYKIFGGSHIQEYQSSASINLGGCE